MDTVESLDAKARVAVEAVSCGPNSLASHNVPYFSSNAATPPEASPKVSNVGLWLSPQASGSTLRSRVK